MNIHRIYCPTLARRKYADVSVQSKCCIVYSHSTCIDLPNIDNTSHTYNVKSSQQLCKYIRRSLGGDICFSFSLQCYCCCHLFYVNYRLFGFNTRINRHSITLSPRVKRFLQEKSIPYLKQRENSE